MRTVKRAKEQDGAELASPTTTPKELDDIVQELWEAGWNPKTDNVELLTRDLGLLLTEVILELLGGIDIPITSQRSVPLVYLPAGSSCRGDSFP